jgi:DNA-binding response OmpR family regulator
MARKQIKAGKMFKGKHILVVEDQPFIGEILTGILRRYDHPSYAKSAKEALKKISQETPDIILMDVTLPDMNGLELARTLRQNTKTNFIPILAMSGFPINKKNWREAGCNDFIAKPFKAGDLLSRLEGLLRRPKES